MGAFTCVSATTTQKDACVPNFDPAIVGFGTFDTTAGFYPGVGGFPNPEWVYAALVVSGGSQTILGVRLLSTKRSQKLARMSTNTLTMIMLGVLTAKPILQAL